ncbi:unnamed protein product [Caenorhabditis sp. 36 PRJEB53466]|nr:unnamed protein product [Caenorhabditis sp. 36 PRJEB53466]
MCEEEEEVPIRKFMFHNLTVCDRGHVTYQEIRQAIVHTLAQIGFRVPGISVLVEQFDAMPDGNASVDHRFWATFQVDRPSAAAIFEQRHGRNEQIAHLNSTENRTIETHLNLRQYKGLRYEAVKATLRATAKKLAKKCYRDSDGYSLEVVKDTIHLKRDGRHVGILTVQSLAENHRDAVERVIRRLPGDLAMRMRKLTRRIGQESPANTITSAAKSPGRSIPPTPPPVGKQGFRRPDTPRHVA